MIQILLVTALCLDAFAASFAYGINKTRIPVKSMIIISMVCTAVLALSMGIGSAAKQVIPEGISSKICFYILFVIGTLKCFESALKRYIPENQNRENKIKLKLFDINFVLTVYADNIKADIDNSKELSAKEAVYLALALSLDGFAAGFGCGLTDINYVEIIALSLISNILVLGLGYLIGKVVTKITDMDLSWLGGVILIVLAFLKLKA